MDPHAQEQPAATVGSNRPWEITDNSFLVEEAFNQEPGIFQNIFGIYRPGDGSWVSAFTQEWPVRIQAHQLSYTVAFGAPDPASGIGDVLLHYRFQLWSESPGGRRSRRVCPCLSDRRRGEEDWAAAVPGWEVNLPFSKQVRDLYLHWNAGFTHLPSAEGVASGTQPPDAADRGKRHLARAPDAEPDARKRVRMG